MPAKDFKFISPGIFINEIDNSQLPREAGDIGPAIIGRAEQGPGLVPTKINSFQEFVEVFGAPNPGGTTADSSREGGISGPTYGGYAAQAWLRNNSPVTFVRLLGQQHSNATDGEGEAGWETTNIDPATDDSQGGAYGLFVFQSASLPGGSGITETTGTLAAIWYANTGSVALTGTLFSGSSASEAATATITVGGSSFPFMDNESSITLKDATGADVVVTLANGTPTSTNGTIGGDGVATKQVMAQRIAQAINATTGADMTAAPTDGSSNVITVTQATKGFAGNQTITTTPPDGSPGLAQNSNLVLPAGFTGGKGVEGKAGIIDTGEQGVGTNKFVQATAAREFKVQIKGNNGTVQIESKFNFNNTSENFIRKVFNTNPTMTNSDITDTDNAGYVDYWLGETYEDEVNALLDANAGSQHFGVILPLFRGNTSGGDFRRDYNEACTGYFISQDLTNNPDGFTASEQQKLFRLKARNSGQWTSKNTKVSISDIRASSDPANPYGSFTVLIRKIDDTDNRPKILEQFNNCNLNPASENFIARKIGDKYLEWDDDDRRYKELGDFANQSDYVYVDLDKAVKENKHNRESLPFGVVGPPRFMAVSASDQGATKTLVTGGFNFADNGDSLGAVGLLVSGGLDYPVKFKFPELRLRVSSSEGNPTDPTAVFFGVDTTFNLGRSSKQSVNTLVQSHSV